MRSCDRAASGPRTYSPLTSKAPPQTDISANLAIMSSNSEEPTIASTGTILSTANLTPSQQTNTPEERQADGEAQQDSTTTPHELQCVACDCKYLAGAMSACLLHRLS